MKGLTFEDLLTSLNQAAKVKIFKETTPVDLALDNMDKKKVTYMNDYSTALVMTVPQRGFLSMMCL